MTTRAALVLGALVVLAVVLFVIGVSVGGNSPILQRPASPSEMLEAMHGWSGTTLVMSSVLIVLLAPYVTMLTVAGWKMRPTRLWFAIGTLSLTVASLIAAWLAR